MSHYFPLYENIFSLNLFVFTIQFITNMSEKQRNKYILRSIIYIYIYLKTSIITNFKTMINFFYFWL